MRFAAVHQMTDSTLKIHAQLWQMKVALIAPSVRQMTNVEDKNHFRHETKNIILHKVLQSAHSQTHR